MPTTVPLSKALTTHNGEVMSLTLRDLDANDIVKMTKAPYNLRQKAEGVEVDINYSIMMQYLSMLSGIDDIILGKLSSKDFQTACNAVAEVWNGVGE